VTSTDAYQYRLDAAGSGDVPWVMSISTDRVLQVDLDSGVERTQWEELLDAIIQELPDVDRVRFIAPGLTQGEEELLNTLLMVLERGDVDVEWR
jgi:hypothetical protein